MPMFSPTSFVYVPDEEKYTKQNLDEAVEHMLGVIGEIKDYRLTLEVVVPDSERLDAKELTGLLQRAQEDAVAYEKAEFVPIGVDGRGKVMYQRREDLDGESAGDGAK